MSNQDNFDIRKARIEDISIVNAQINNETELIALPKEKYIYNIGYSFEVALNFEIKKLRIVHFCDVKVCRVEDKEPIAINAKFDIAYYFVFQNFDELFENPDIEVKEHIVTSLINIVYPTSRGILFTRCQGTILKNLILPILPTDEIKKFEKEFLPLPSEKK